VDSYLEIARAVLKSSRQPLSAREILKVAHQMQLVPRDLYGRTQHKTLQARLASDILKNRSKSDFFRTSPGRFFLRMFQLDRTLPGRYRQEYQAPLRAAQLGRFDVVAFPRAALTKFASVIESPFLAAELTTLSWRFVRLYNLRKKKELVPFRFRLLLLEEEKIFLDSRRSTSDDDALTLATRVGIEGHVQRDDLSLFSKDTFGLIEAALRTLFENLELPNHIIPTLEDERRWSQAYGIIQVDGSVPIDLTVFISLQCAGVVEILDAVDARQNSDWVTMPITLNDTSRFDRWSKKLIEDVNLQKKLCI